ncbi:hypothetical protein L249_2395 [Ophiocordyceps polyrhachis-furcata BCC 54312]|uniref:Type 1 phosphatases regulator n=1 Tax=Ophiocordyceps polyrhachis-furcata BCC 54312 TaxID=1330021 RepID=A0A367LPI6_9HYPO|nr:hypothetical protein L249_2395 [Ophiocordyceps polyrhachis-furcata BCC 54312]
MPQMADGQRQQQRSAPTASQTTTTTTTTTTTSQSRGLTEPPRTLYLRGGGTGNGRSVQWAEDVVNNEGLGRKSSKVCCIYHKPKAVDESSDESSSSDSDSSDSDSGDGADGEDGPAGKMPACGRGRRPDDRRGAKQKRPPSPNAYEKVPKQKPKADSATTKQ